MKSKLNTEWHRQNRMPIRATLEQRIEWHVAHIKNCTCRKPTGQVLEEMKKRGLAS